MKNSVISLILFVLLLQSCKTAVNLILNTKEEVSHSAVVTVEDKNKIRTGELNSGIITKDNPDTLHFKSKRDGYFKVTSSLTNGGTIVFSTSDISLSGRPNPFTFKVDIVTNTNRIDDTKSQSTLSNSFKKIGNDLGVGPLNIRDAINNNIGSLIIARMDSNNKVVEILYSIHPNVLGVKKVSLEDINWPNNLETQKIDITGSTATSMSANIPLFAKFGANFSSDKVYNLRWEMKGFGQNSKQEDPDKSPAKMIESLNAEELNQIQNLLTQYTDAKMYYINQFYVLKNAELYTKEAQKVNGAFDASSAVISGNTVFSFENSQEKHNSYADQVLSLWGNEYKIGLEKEKIEKGGGDKVDYIYLLRSREIGNANSIPLNLIEKNE